MQMQKCFEDLKSAINKNVCFKYYDANTPLTLKVDVSQKGLSTAQVWNNTPIAFG